MEGISSQTFFDPIQTTANYSSFAKSLGDINDSLTTHDSTMSALQSCKVVLEDFTLETLSKEVSECKKRCQIATELANGIDGLIGPDLQALTERAVGLDIKTHSTKDRKHRRLGSQQSYIAGVIRA